jgi:hypothetical protein
VTAVGSGCLRRRRAFTALEASSLASSKVRHWKLRTTFFRAETRTSQLPGHHDFVNIPATTDCSRRGFVNDFLFGG